VKEKPLLFVFIRGKFRAAEETGAGREVHKMGEEKKVRLDKPEQMS
jgi:hypothetical protein